jgi:hypothetical protein
MATGELQGSRFKIIEEEGLQIRVIHLNDLISAKKAAGRYRLDDIEKLTKAKK